MESVRIVITGDNITSPLGLDTKTNFKNIREGNSRLCFHEDMPGVKEGFVGSVLDRKEIERILSETLSTEKEYTFFEKLSIYSVREAIKESGINAGEREVIFIISTTKGNVSVLQEELNDARAYLPYSAKKIAEYFGNLNTPIVVSNACISGVCAQITAARLLATGYYKTAVVIGCDVLSNFIISGFQSFKALSDCPCKPFDTDRKGLNLGEAAATMIFQVEKQPSKRLWQYIAGAIRNDSNHISAPSRTAEGTYAVIEEIKEIIKPEEIGFVNGHGTATLYNDDMESVAMHRSGLQSLPFNSLKGYFGHTLGAAGILETILSMKAAEEGLILGTKGFEKQGTVYPLNVTSDHRDAQTQVFMKLLSGFGGTNAAVAYGKDRDWPMTASGKIKHEIANRVKIGPKELKINDKVLVNPGLTELYREEIGGYPRFFKMDRLSRLGIIASEYLLKDISEQDKAQMAVLLFNRSGSLDTDRRYQETIEENNYYPSPSVFVYTLANIVEGEISIKNGIHGETSFYLLPGKDEKTMEIIIDSIFRTSGIERMLTGWLDYESEIDYCADLKLIKRKQTI